MSDSIKVAIKVRPLIKREKEDNLSIQWTVQNNFIVSTDPELKKRGDGGFHFDHIFDENTNNWQVFDTVVKPIVDATVNGINGTVFAYGQTSSGKTYTMMGTSSEPGIIPLAVEHMFNAIANTMRREFLLRVSYLEIYNEKINDLLNNSCTDLKLHEDNNGQIIIKCKEEVTNSPEHVLSIMKKGNKNRRIGETNMNERSSRSHTIFRITIESRELDADSDGAIQVSQLNLVDLAGSERARQTGATGERFKEGRHINMSLSTLGLVIMQLSESQDTQKYVNFRDSKLTRLLQASLGGNAMTAIICAITPAALEESQCTLSFASRAKSVKNKPQINEVMSDATLLKRYAKQIARLNSELEKIKQENRSAEEMETKLHEKDKINQILEERIELLQTRIVTGENLHNEESFKCKSRRRRTWGGPGTLRQSALIFPPKGKVLPTIKEMSPEKPCRKHIIQSVDLMDQSFQTAFADFELELIEDERDREIEEDIESEDEASVTKQKTQRRVQFLDDISVHRSSSETFDTPKNKHISTQSFSPDTPKNVLREKIRNLTKEFNDLRQFTTLEKQLFIEDHLEQALQDKVNYVMRLNRQSCDKLNVTCVEDEMSLLNSEMQTLKVDHANLLRLYNEKCMETENLNESISSVLIDESPRGKRDVKRNSKVRIERLEKNVNLVKDDLQRLKSNVSNDLRRSLSDKESLTNEIKSLKRQNEELTEKLREKMSELSSYVSSSSPSVNENNVSESSEVDRVEPKQCESKKISEELNSARKCILREIKSLKGNSESEDFSEKSVEDLFLIFLQTIMAKEREIVCVMQNEFANEKRILKEETEQSLDAEKRATSWAKELENEIERLQNELAEQEMKYKQLQQKLDHTEEVLRENEGQKQILQEKLKLLELDYTNIKEEFDRRDSDVKALERTIITMQNKEPDVENISKDIELSLLPPLLPSNENELQSDKIHEKNTKIEELKKNVENLQKIEKDLRNSLSAKSAELERSNKSTEKIRLQLEELKGAYDSLKQQDKEKLEKLNLLIEESEQLKAEVNDSKVIVAKLKSRVEQQEMKVSDVTNEYTSEQNKCSELKNELRKLEEKNNSLMTELDALKELQEKNNLLTTEVETLKEHCEELEEKNVRLQKKIRNSVTKSHAETELEELRDQKKTIQTNFEGASNRVNELQNREKQLQEEIKLLNERYDSLFEEFTEMKKTMDALAEKKTCEDKDYLELLERYDAILKEKNRIMVELEKTKTSLDTQNQLLEKFESHNNLLEEKLKVKDDLNSQAQEKTVQNDSEVNQNLYCQENTQNKEFQLNKEELLELQKKYKEILEEKSKVMKELENAKTLLSQQEKELDHFRKQIVKLEKQNKELDEEAENLTQENRKLSDKIDSFFDDDGEIIKLDNQVKVLMKENTHLQKELQELGNEKKYLVERIQYLIHQQNNENINKCNNIEHARLSKRIQEIELDLVSKNGKIATLELQIQSESFPYQKKCKDLEENLLAFRNKNIQLEYEIRKLRKIVNEIGMKECYICRQQTINKKDQCTQTIVNEKIQFCGTSSGIIEEHAVIRKLEKEKCMLKDVCRLRNQRIKELEEKIILLGNVQCLVD